jgi:hypothetical protein
MTSAPRAWIALYASRNRVASFVHNRVNAFGKKNSTTWRPFSSLRRRGRPSVADVAEKSGARL